MISVVTGHLNPTGICQCGCGQVTPVYSRTRGELKRGSHARYVRGHWLRERRRTDIAPPNPSGICQCGCGLPAPIATMTHARFGHVAGEPMRFILGHVGHLKRRESITPDLWREEDRGYTTPCWIWQLAPKSSAGYGTVWLRGRETLAHRAMYEQEIAPIPPGLVIDHLCRQTRCVNPSHLEAVTPTVNQRRSSARLTEDDVATIRASKDRQSDLARRFSVAPSHISRIRSGQAWK